MTWVEMQLLKAAGEARSKDPALDRACEMYEEALTVPKHYVRPGETLIGISRQHGVPIQSLMEFNGMSGPLGIRPGQALRIPTQYNGGLKKGV